MSKNVQSNIWKYALLLVANKRIFVAILGAYYLTIPDVTPKIIGVILLVGNLAGFIFEIPSGYVSDKIGHKQAIIISRACVLLSTILFLISNNAVLLIVAAIFLSMGAAFLSGTGSALMHETLRALGREHEYAKIMGKISSIGFAVPIILTALVPFLVSISYKLPFLVACVTDSVGLLAAFILVYKPVSQEHIEEVNSTNFRQVLREGYRLGFFVFALFSGIVSGTLFGIGGFRAPFQISLGIPVVWFGVLFGIGRLGASLLLAYSGRIEKRITMRVFYGFELIFYTILIISLGFSSRWIVAGVLIIINAFQWGLNKIDEGYLLQIIPHSKFKATLLSVASQIDLIVGAVVSFVIGLAIEHFSYQRSFVYLGIAFFVILFVVYLKILRVCKQNLKPLF